MSEKTLEELEFEETGVTRKERWKVMWASILGYAMDGLDVLILSFAMAAIVSEFGLTLGEGGLIATYTMIGTVLGGYLFGIMADYVGRVHTFAVTIILFSIFTGACAFADSATHLEIFRFLAGLGLGGEYGIGMTLVSETWPAAKRARATAGVAMGWQAGAVLAAVLAAAILPSYGWRGLFLVGVVPALLAAWSRHGIKEPPMWVKRKALKKELKERFDRGEQLTAEEMEQLESTHKFPLILLFNSPRRIVTTVALTIMTSVQNFGYYGIMVWLPMILLREHGLTTNSMAGWMIVTVVGMIAGIYVFGFLRPSRPQEAVSSLLCMLRSHGLCVCQSGHAHGAPLRRRIPRLLLQRHDGRLRHAAVGKLHHGCPFHRTELHLQYGPRRGRLRTGHHRYDRPGKRLQHGIPAPVLRIPRSGAECAVFRPRYEGTDHRIRPEKEKTDALQGGCLFSLGGPGFSSMQQGTKVPEMFVLFRGLW